MEAKLVNELAQIHYALTWACIWLFCIACKSSTVKIDKEDEK